MKIQNSRKSNKSRPAGYSAGCVKHSLDQSVSGLMSGTAELLLQQLAFTEALLHRVYVGCKGFSKDTQPVSNTFVSTHYDVARKLAKSFPEHPRTLSLEKVS